MSITRRFTFSVGVSSPRSIEKSCSSSATFLGRSYYLDLDMSRTIYETLDKDLVTAERVQRFASRHFYRRSQIASISNDTHPLATTTRGRL